MFEINDKEIKELEADLKTFAHRAYPFATKNTINVAAFSARSYAQENIRESMVTRNKFTERSVRVDRAFTLNVSRQISTVGSIADYMELQELGGTKTKPAIPTSYAAGQTEGTSPRTRLPRRANKLSNIKLRRKRKRGLTRRRQNAIRVRAAAQSGHKYVFLDLARGKGIFKVIGGKRRPRVKMIYDLSRKSVRIPKRPWLRPAMLKSQQEIPEVYKESLMFQLRRQGLLR